MPIPPRAKTNEPIRILAVAGARPNFMKIAPLMHELAKRPSRFEPILVHTGQHYDKAMSDSFFRDLGIPTPDINAEAQEIADAATAFRKVLAEKKKQIESQPVAVRLSGNGRICRNGPCPCGSHKKYKRCCLGLVKNGNLPELRAGGEVTKTPPTRYEAPKQRKKREFDETAKKLNSDELDEDCFL